MLELILLFILKILDSGISVAKTLLLIRNKDFASSLCMAISQFFYLTILVKIAKNDTTLGILVVCLGAFIGSYIPKFMSVAT